MTQLKFHVNIMELIANSDDSDLWNCDVCVKKKRIYERNCKHPNFSIKTETEIEEKSEKSTNKYSIIPKRVERTKEEAEQKKGKKASFTLPDDSRMNHCPLSHLDKGAMDFLNLVYWSEEIKIMPFMPNAIMEQSNVYVEGRWAIITQRSKIRALEAKKEEEKRKQETKRGKTLRKK